jgi:hypothetical protein
MAASGTTSEFYYGAASDSLIMKEGTVLYRIY